MSATLTRPVDEVVELRCDRRKHGELIVDHDRPTGSQGRIQIHCRYCSHAAKRHVIHVWDAATGERLEDQ